MINIPNNIMANIWNKVNDNVYYNVWANAHDDTRSIGNVYVYGNVWDNVNVNIKINVWGNVYATISNKSFTDEQLKAAFCNVELL